MSMNVWNPWDDMMSLREAMNRLLEDSYVRPVQGAAIATRGNLALDLFEDGDNVEVTATLPGMDPDDVEITVQGDVLVIKGQHKQEQERKQGNYHLRERRVGSFYRAVQLPTAVQPDKAQVDFRNGVLHLTLPKAEETKPKTIRVGNTPSRLGQGETQRMQTVEGERVATPAGNTNNQER
jgi:HSP20 family protein